MTPNSLVHQQMFVWPLWRTLHRSIKYKAHILERDAGLRIITVDFGQTNKFKLKNTNTGEELELKLSEDAPSLWFRTDGPSGYLTIAVSADGFKFFDARRVSFFADEVADAMIALLAK